MKKIFFVLGLFLIIVGCGEKKSKIELIENNDFIYFSINELNNKPVLRNNIDEIKNEINSAFQKNMSNLKSQPFPIFVAYIYFVGNNGRIEKMSPIEKINDLKAKGINLPQNYFSEIEPEILKILEKVEFTSDSNSVKFRGPLSIGVNSVKGINDGIKGIITSVSFGLETFGNSFTTGRTNGKLEDVYFVAVEEAPGPIGGLEAIQKKITYPEVAKRAGIQGRVFVKAFIDEKGNVVKSEVIKGVHPALDSAAVAAVMKTKFTPGKQRGKPVKVQVSIPIVFALK